MRDETGDRLLYGHFWLTLVAPRLRVEFVARNLWRFFRATHHFRRALVRESLSLYTSTTLIRIYTGTHCAGIVSSRNILHSSMLTLALVFWFILLIKKRWLNEIGSSMSFLCCKSLCAPTRREPHYARIALHYSLKLCERSVAHRRSLWSSASSTAT